MQCMHESLPSAPPKNDILKPVSCEVEDEWDSMSISAHRAAKVESVFGGERCEKFYVLN